MLRLLDAHTQHTPRTRRWVTTEIDDPVVVSAAREHGGIVFTRPLDEHGQYPAAIRAEVFAFELLVKVEKTVEPLRGDVVIDRRSELQRGRTRTRRVFERVQRSVADLVHQRNRLLEI